MVSFVLFFSLFSWSRSYSLSLSSPSFLFRVSPFSLMSSFSRIRCHVDAWARKNERERKIETVDNSLQNASSSRLLLWKKINKQKSAAFFFHVNKSILGDRVAV